jgi:uncharacterized membrane-anchored protein
MEKKNNLRDELLKQMEQNSGGSSNVNQKSIQAIIAKDTARVRRLKRATVVSWLLLAASFVVTGIIGALTGFRKELWIVIPIIGVQALLIIAVSCTISLYAMSRTLNMRQIQATLSEIQERLKKMSQDK